jgi:DNA-binding response OmpR family regulator
VHQEINQGRGPGNWIGAKIKNEFMTKRILLIDDEVSILEILEDFLTSAGFHVKILTKTEDIFSSIAAYQPDLALVDYLLNGINGGEVCAQIKKNEQTRHIPVILMTAYPRVLLSLGTYSCDEFIEKPFDLDHLVKRIEHHLANSGKLSAKRGAAR